MRPPLRRSAAPGDESAPARAWDLWRVGTEAAAELFPEWRLLSLETSLRRAQRRLPEALELLDRARGGYGGDERWKRRCRCRSL